MLIYRGKRLFSATFYVVQAIYFFIVPDYQTVTNYNFPSSRQEGLTGKLKENLAHFPLVVRRLNTFPLKGGSQSLLITEMFIHFIRQLKRKGVIWRHVIMFI